MSWLKPGQIPRTVALMDIDLWLRRIGPYISRMRHMLFVRCDNVLKVQLDLEPAGGGSLRMVVTPVINTVVGKLAMQMHAWKGRYQAQVEELVPNSGRFDATSFARLCHRLHEMMLA